MLLAPYRRFGSDRIFPAKRPGYLCFGLRAAAPGVSDGTGAKLGVRRQ